MAEEQIVQNMIRQLGQSQTERSVPELRDHFVDVDERDPARLLAFATRLAPLVRYYDSKNAPAGDWAPFFRADDVERVLQPAPGDVTPHLALFGAFLGLYDKSREVINRLTGEHLRFFYERVLGFERRAARPDRAHVLVDLKNNTPQARIGPEHRLTAGKGPQGERLYAPVGETIVRGAKVASLRSLFIDGGRAIHVAPIANSADGLGGEWETPERNWRAFGDASLPKASIGFGIASPVLRMAEGRRAITCLLQLDHADATAIKAADVAFDAYVTGAKGWIGPYRADASVEGSALALGIVVPSTEPPVVDYTSETHGLAYTAEAPIIQFHLRSDAGNLPLDVLRGAIVRGARIRVSVSGVTSLILESDVGSLNPKKAFLPFGPTPSSGSRFLVGYPEALSKKLTTLKIRVRWLGLPNFSNHYDGYDADIHSADQFKAFASFHDGGSWEVRGALMPLFVVSDIAARWSEFAFDASGTSTSPPPSRGRQVDSLYREKDQWARRAERSVFGLSQPRSLERIRTFERLQIPRLLFERYLDVRPSNPREGTVMFTLQRDFLHALYRQKAVENALKQPPVVIREPYTPAIQAIELDYVASTAEIDVSSTDLAKFSNPDVQFFHVDAFGQRREHGYRRASVPFVTGPDVPLLPEHRYEGELLIGLEGVAARDTLSLLVQVAEATANPDLPPAHVEWAALCDNDWKRLRPEELAADGSNEFRRSGIVSLVMPRETTTAHTVMPSGLTWLRAAVAENSGAACRLVAVESNAIEVKLELSDPLASADHLATALPPGTIAKLKTPLAGVKAVTQPYASFDGRPRESAAALHVRASERLRHKDRCITPWDYERIVLEHFPSVHRVKCVPHARDGAWLAPGNVLLVVVPDLRNRTAGLASDAPLDPTEPVAMDLLQPRVDIDTLTEIAGYVQGRCGKQVLVHVENPRYQKIRLAFQVKFHRGKDFHYHRSLLSNALIRFLSPWAFDGASSLSFGGRVFRSVLLDFIEELDYVDFLTSFSMFVDSGGVAIDTPEAIPDRPDSILVSDAEHTITEADIADA